MSPELIIALGGAVGSLVKAIVTAVQANDISAVEALAKVLPTAEVLALKDKMLIEAQQRKAEAALGNI